MVSLVAVLTVVAAVGSGLMGGVFFAFSVAVIPRCGADLPPTPSRRCRRSTG
jgi:uncharacterized membrane protein